MMISKKVQKKSAQKFRYAIVLDLDDIRKASDSAWTSWLEKSIEGEINNNNWIVGLFAGSAPEAEIDLNSPPCPQGYPAG